MDSSRQIRDDTSVERAPNRSRQVRRSISRRQRNAALLPSSPDRHPILQHAAIQECAQHRERTVAEAGLLLKPSSLNAKTFFFLEQASRKRTRAQMAQGPTQRPPCALSISMRPVPADCRRHESYAAAMVVRHMPMTSSYGNAYSLPGFAIVAVVQPAFL